MKERYLIQISKSFFVLLLCTLLSFLFILIQIRTENTIMLYLIGVIFIVISTKSFVCGIASSVISIITFNYFFTNPKYSLAIDDPNYIITIIVFFIASFITSSLIDKLQQHACIAKYNEQQTSALYEISKSYLTISGLHQIILYTIDTLYASQRISMAVYYHNTATHKLELYQRENAVSNSDLEFAKSCYENAAANKITTYQNHLSWAYYPLYEHDRLLGVYCVFQNEHYGKNKDIYIHTLISQMVLAIEREHLYIAQEDNKIEIEKEKLRNTLLRSISHDLRTPLTSIAGSSTLITEKYDTLSDETIYNLVKTISYDACWLNQLVENLLNMTRIQDGKLLLKKQKEVVDDILYEALAHVESRKGTHHIQLHLPETIVCVSMDGKLMIQVLINLIDNAIKHTPKNATIDISCHIYKDKAVFEVMDDGSGIDPEIQEYIFDSFVTTNSNHSDAQRGIGLGLSIAKAIIDAHQGKIYAYNRRDEKGAVFGFSLPYECESEDIK